MRKKFDHLIGAIQELPNAGSEVDLERLLHDVYTSLNPYSKPPQPQTSDRAAEECTEFGSLLDPAPVVSRAAGNGLGHIACKPVIADRMKWKYPPTFNPKPFLTDPLAKAAFDSPDALRLFLGEVAQGFSCKGARIKT